MDIELFIWSGVMLVGFAGSALYSGMETGAYSLNRVRLQIYHHERYRSAGILHRLFDDPTRLLTTLLIGNNIANYMGTAGLAVLLERWGIGEWQAIVLNTLIVTPILFVFGETLPKDLFAAYADRLMYRLAWVVEASHKVFWWCGLGPVIGWVTRSLMKLLKEDDRVSPFHPRLRVQALMKEGVGHGLLSDDQSAMVERALSLSSRSVGDEMVPWSQVLTVQADAPPEALRELANRTSRSRFPVVDDSGAVVGQLNLIEALRYEPGTTPPVRELMQPATRLRPELSVRRALERLRAERWALAIVEGRSGEPLGLVTMKDLVEAVTGELASW